MRIGNRHEVRRGLARHGVGESGLGYFLAPSIRFIFVPQTGHVPWAARRPLASSTSVPSNCRFSRHFTQYPSWVAIVESLLGEGRIGSRGPVDTMRAARRAG